MKQVALHLNSSRTSEHAPITSGEQPMENHTESTPDEKSHGVKRITLFCNKTRLIHSLARRCLPWRCREIDASCRHQQPETLISWHSRDAGKQISWLASTSPSHSY